MRARLIALATISACFTFGLPTNSLAKTFEQRYDAVTRVLERENASCRVGFPEVRRIIEIMKQDEELKKATYGLSMMSTICAMRVEDYEAVLEFSPDAEKIEQIGEGYDAKAIRSVMARQGLNAAFILERGDVALATFRRLASFANEVELAEKLGSNDWFVLLRYARLSPKPADELGFLDSQLERIEYKGLNAVEASLVRQQVVFDRITHATDLNDMSALVSRIQNPNYALEILIDNRYANQRARPEATRLRDLMAMAQADVVTAAATAAQNPTLLEAQTTYARSLRQIDRPAEALAVLEATQAKLASSRQHFVDADEQENWLFNDKAHVLRDMGRVDEGIAVMQAASKLKSEGGQNISQTINLAIMQINAGRYANAIATLDLVGVDQSSYGKSLVAGMRYCAQVQLGRPPSNARQVIADLKALGQNGLSAVMATALCVNDLDLAAETYLAILESPADRADALLAAQAYSQESSRRSAFEIQQRSRALQVLARPDIKAKLEAYGSPVTIPFPLRDYEY
jgi:hypothetical protein